MEPNKGANTAAVNEEPITLAPSSPQQTQTKADSQDQDQDMQDGVRVAEAVTKTWSKKSLIIAYASMRLLYFVNGLNNNLTSNLDPYITSDFQSHSLINVIGVVKSVMGAACLIPIASGLMIYFRQPGDYVGYICMCQIFLAVSGGTLILIEQAAVLAASKHEEYAGMLALLSTFGNLGSAVGSSVSGAIWTNTLPVKLHEYLPVETRDDWQNIYENLEVQLSYPRGSATRIAIENAYAASQRNMLVAGTSIMALSIGWAMMMRNLKVKDNKDVAQVLF